MDLLALFRAVSGSELPKDLVVATRAEFERYKGVADTIYYAACREGRVVSERQA